jgi:hypothetical protein
MPAVLNGIPPHILEDIERHSRLSVSIAPGGDFEVKQDGAFVGYFPAREIRELHNKVTP